jgi:hypothetical protein
MQREKHLWWQQLQANAERSGTENPVYADEGQWATLTFQITGDRRYAEKAMQMIRRRFAMGDPSSDFHREHLADFVVMYDWLYPALSAAERTLFLQTLDHWCDLATTSQWTPEYPIRAEDSDQTIGDYFGFAFLALATAPDNSRATEYLNRPYVGGLSSTGLDRTTMRNTIRQYVTEMAEGGEWIEGSWYNNGTLPLLLMGAEGVRTATGRDYFPELAEFLGKAALAQIHELSPDLMVNYEWGDVDTVRTLALFRRQELLGMLAGLTQDDARVGPFIHYLVEDLAARYGREGEAAPEPRFFMFYNPYAATADWRTTLPRGYYAPGQGMMFFHDSWDPAASFLGIHMPKRQPYVDHQVAYFGDFQLYRKHEWVVAHPIGYGGNQVPGPTSTGEGTNCMLMGGLSSMTEVKGVIAQEFGPADEYAYIAGTTSGQFYEKGFYDPPPTFLHEWTRSIFYLPSKDKRSDTLVVFDRTNATPPANIEKYRLEDQQVIRAAPALKQWLIHCPVPPTLTPEAITWMTPGGQHVTVSTLLPVAQKRLLIDEDKVWGKDFPYPDKAEQKWQVRIMPGVEQPWDTFLNVVQAYDAGVDLRNVLVQSTRGEAQGVLVQRADQDDTLVMFGAQPASRVVNLSYSVNWTSTTPRTQVYLLDLEPGNPWTASVDEAAAMISVSQQGVGSLALTGTGPHSLRITAAGGATP